MASLSRQKPLFGTELAIVGADLSAPTMRFLASKDFIMCDCAENLNKLLVEKNTRLLFATLIDKDLNLKSRLSIATEKIDSKIRKPMPIITGQFCPFCGEREEQL